MTTPKKWSTDSAKFTPDWGPHAIDLGSAALRLAVSTITILSALEPLFLSGSEKTLSLISHWRGYEQASDDFARSGTALDEARLFYAWLLLITATTTAADEVGSKLIPTLDAIRPNVEEALELMEGKHNT